MYLQSNRYSFSSASADRHFFVLDFYFFYYAETEGYSHLLHSIHLIFFKSFSEHQTILRNKGTSSHINSWGYHTFCRKIK